MDPHQPNSARHHQPHHRHYGLLIHRDMRYWLMFLGLLSVTVSVSFHTFFGPDDKTPLLLLAKEASHLAWRRASLEQFADRQPNIQELRQAVVGQLAEKPVYVGDIRGSLSRRNATKPIHVGGIRGSSMSRRNSTNNSSTAPALIAEKSPEQKAHAYAFVVGGCDPQVPAYRHFLFNILIATKLLRQLGSQADIVVLFQMSNDSQLDTLPEQDARLLRAMNIHAYLIPRHPGESFYRTVLDKFRILGLTQYSRILLLDGDVMPLSNLDYLFHMSEDGVLKENFVLAGKLEPANAGFFMLAPRPGKLKDIQNVIRLREEEARRIGYPYFNETLGWGHAIEDNDKWVHLKGTGQKWDFFAAFADQGLLYHWVKYHQRSVSIAIGDTVQNWGKGPDGKAKLESVSGSVFVNVSKPIYVWGGNSLYPPYSDFVHFTGRSKPWIIGPPAVEISEATKFDSPQKFWFYCLQQLNDELGMGLNLSDWNSVSERRRPTHGLYSAYVMIPNATTNLLEPMTVL